MPEGATHGGADQTDAGGNARGPSCMARWERVQVVAGHQEGALPSIVGARSRSKSQSRRLLADRRGKPLLSWIGKVGRTRTGSLGDASRQWVSDAGNSRRKNQDRGDFSNALAMLWAHLDSNQGPTGYEPVALPLSYGPVLPAASGILPWRLTCVKTFWAESLGQMPTGLAATSNQPTTMFTKRPGT